jgi:hypothetical protein
MRNWGQNQRDRQDDETKRGKERKEKKKKTQQRKEILTGNWKREGLLPVSCRGGILGNWLPSITSGEIGVEEDCLVSRRCESDGW